jgi:hypothetical protein
MSTLTETMVDVADCRTTLYYLSKNPPAQAPLSLGTRDGYEELHETVRGDGTTGYVDLTGTAGTIINRVFHAYRKKSKYWTRFAGDDGFPIFNVKPWDRILPLEVSLLSRVEFVNDGTFKFKVSPVPTVLIYPFGWSTWLSLRLTSAHTISDLSRFVQYVFNGKAFKVNGGQALTLREYFTTVGAGIRADAFGGDKNANISSSQQFVLVTTVIAKHGGTRVLKLLTPEEQLEMLRIVKPEGPPPKKDFNSYVYPASAKDPLQFVIMNDLSRFIWLENLLQSVGQNRVWLGCHHDNTTRSLIHALQLHRLISVSSGNKQDLPAQLLELLETSKQQLSSPGYKNLSLRVFLESPEVKASIEKVNNLK